MILCVAGNPAIDKLVEVDALRAGEIHRPDAFVPLPGGKGIHVAQVATALGASADRHWHPRRARRTLAGRDARGRGRHRALRVV